MESPEQSLRKSYWRNMRRRMQLHADSVVAKFPHLRDRLEALVRPFYNQSDPTTDEEERVRRGRESAIDAEIRQMIADAEKGTC